jgi:hypothetical protein
MTNKPLYMTKQYQLTYEPSDLPTHYSFIRDGIGLDGLERRYREALVESIEDSQTSAPVAEGEIRRILNALDQRGAWVEQGTLGSQLYRGPIIDSRTFIRNVDRLSRYLVDP